MTALDQVYEPDANDRPWRESEARAQAEQLRWTIASPLEQAVRSDSFHFGCGCTPPLSSYDEFARRLPVPFHKDKTATESAGPPPALPTTAWLRGFHREALVEFANTVGFGLIEDREHVVGFKSHGFGHDPWIGGDWWSVRIELIRLRKDEEPAVYVSDCLPNMDALRNAPLRPLNEFEQRGLAATRGRQRHRERGHGSGDSPARRHSGRPAVSGVPRGRARCAAGGILVRTHARSSRANGAIGGGSSVTLSRTE